MSFDAMQKKKSVVGTHEMAMFVRVGIPGVGRSGTPGFVEASWSC
jgi:hypothetical protein